MSLFKVKQWWSNNKLQETTCNIGTQCTGCLRVDKFNSYTDSDCIIIAEEFYLKIYKPTPNQLVSDILLETQVNDVILQIEIGKFTAGTTDRQIIVLHPLKYVVYQLEKKEGLIDAGDQNILKTTLKHTFTRRAYSLSCGPFGNIKTRDLICVQGLDGSLSFFDQETFLFMCIFDDVIIPGPICYIASCDSFVISKSTWILEIYSYQQLREFSEVNLRQNKKNIPQWIYNAGEEISSVQVIQTSTNFSSIVALGERYLYCFQDNGLMKYMLKFEYMPVCVCAYLIGWFYEPTSRLLVMVASDDAKLYIYESTTLLWSCDLLDPPIALTRCFLKSLPGGIVTLSAKGVVTVSYLGTEPDLNSNAPPMINETIDPEEVQAVLEKVEEELQSILETKGEVGNYNLGVAQSIKIKAEVGKPTQNLYQEYPNDSEEALHLIMCPVIVTLSCEDPNIIENIQITYACHPPFACSESVISLDGMNGTEIVESQVFLTSDTDIVDTYIDITLTITDNIRKIIVLEKKVSLPVSLYCIPATLDTIKNIKLKINTNLTEINFGRIFSDFSEEDLFTLGNSPERVTLAYRPTKKTVTIIAHDGYCTLEADNFPEMTVVLEHFISKLSDYATRMDKKDFKYEINWSKDLFKQITFKFLKSVEIHAKHRIKLKGLEDGLNMLQRQFTLVQKRLLVQYGSLPPGDCESLEFLMRDTHTRLVKCAHQIVQCKEDICRAGCTLVAMGRLLIYIFKQSSLESFKMKLVEETLCLNSLYDDYQDWEEAVSQSLSYIMNNVFKNTEKDREKLAPVTEQGVLSHINLKRFLKQIRILLEKLFLEAYGEESEPPHQTNSRGNQIIRIEEFVDVI
ncbi:unnamed protein product [Chilo suppressalis]|uniref:Protein PTHB1 n=1 Tax=Chilo suppressalis TaxID=168631 RepID=A0ABN8BFI7_CHISP|nr:unnamed protein product [Chilo suppressalis]